MMSNLTRREALSAGAAMAAAVLGSRAIAATGAKPAMTTYRDPGCGCCGKWADLAKAAGYQVTVSPSSNMAAVKERLRVPTALASCHTSTVGGYVVEGHVPFAAVDKLLRTKPKGIIGIAVPGMPAGSPGMEVPGGRTDPIKVTAFNAAGKGVPFSF